MTTKKLIEQTASKINLNDFVAELDALGWRGNYKSNPVEFLFQFLRENETNHEACDMVHMDMLYILNAYGFELINDEIIDMVPR